MDGTVENAKGEERSPTIRDLYPGLSEKQLREADENLHRFLAFVLNMHEPGTRSKATDI
jgi:hypothetical protein